MLAQLNTCGKSIQFFPSAAARLQGKTPICSEPYCSGGNDTLVFCQANCLPQAATKEHSFRCLCCILGSLLQVGTSIAAAVLPCIAYYITRAPSHFSLKFAVSMALLFAASLTVFRTFLLERKHQVEALHASAEFCSKTSILCQLCC